MRVAVFQLDEDKKAIDDSIRELRQMQKYLNSIEEIVQKEVRVNKKAKTTMHAWAAQPEGVGGGQCPPLLGPGGTGGTGAPPMHAQAL